MIKGINKQVLEVTNPDSPYFDKIIFFVKSDYSTKSEGFLKNEAEKIAKQALRPPRNKKTLKQKLTLLSLLLLSAGAGIAISFIMNTLV